MHTQSFLSLWAVFVFGKLIQNVCCFLHLHIPVHSPHRCHKMIVGLLVFFARVTILHADTFCCACSLQLWKGWSAGLVPPSLCRGEKRESNPASFVSFVEEEDEKTSQPEKRDCEEKVGVREVKAYLEERGEGRGGEGEEDVSVSSPVCQLENSWCLLQTPFLSPQRKDR